MNVPMNMLMNVMKAPPPHNECDEGAPPRHTPLLPPRHTPLLPSHHTPLLSSHHTPLHPQATHESLHEAGVAIGGPSGAAFQIGHPRLTQASSSLANECANEYANSRSATRG